MGLNELNRPPADDPPPPDTFADRVRALMPVGASTRLARALEINPRLVQKWMGGHLEPMPFAWEWLEKQEAAFRKAQPRAAIEALLDSWETDYNLHGEISASQIAQLYQDVLDREIE